MTNVFGGAPSVRPEARRLMAVLVIGTASSLALGATLRSPSKLGANDISRWCTIWALLERRSYAIDDCPWRSNTVDVVRRLGPSRLGDQQPPTLHYYSSKPPLLASLIAAILYPVRTLSGVPLDREVKDASGRTWPADVLYIKPVVILLNVVPLAPFLAIYARMLDRLTTDEWAWAIGLFAAAWGTQLLAFAEVLNNHSVAAYSAMFALYASLRIWYGESPAPRLFACAGFFAAFCACNELPAALFGVVLFGAMLVRFPRPALFYFAPAAAFPCVAFLNTQYLAAQTIIPVYSEFGTSSYNFEGSFWKSPTGLDALDEPKLVYLFHMLVGHHGVALLSPIFLFSAYAAVRLWRRTHPLSDFARLTVVLTVVVVGFYTWKTHNYGGVTQGMRWFFWLYPFWLILLPCGLDGISRRPLLRKLALAALFASVVSVGYALPRPWGHPWPLDLLNHLGFYELK